MRFVLIIVLMFIPDELLANPYDVSKFQNTNQLIWDEGFRSHIQQFFGDKKEDYFWNAPIAEQVRAGFGGPSDDIAQPAPNTYLASACRQNSCPEKSAYITNGTQELFAIISFFCTDTNKQLTYKDEGCLVIFFKKEESKVELSKYLIDWKNRHQKLATVEYVLAI